MVNLIAGRKTYTVAAVWLVYAVGGWLLGEIPQEDMTRMVFEALGIGALRNGIAKA